MIRVLSTSDELDMDNEPHKTINNLNVLDNNESDNNSMLQFNTKEKSIISSS